MMYIKYMLFLIVFILTLYPAFNQGIEIKLKTLDALFQNSMKAWEIPGMAIAIVKDDSVIFAKGYGVRNIEKGGVVDENTVFGIASNTKAFTTASLAILNDQGKINWDDKVVKYLPYFEMYDSYVTNDVKIRDLLCHRSGYKTFSGDLLWHSTIYSREDIIKRIKYLEPEYGFRSHYGYSNLMFLTAGEIIPVVSGLSFDDFLKTNFFEPLGMKNTCTSIKGFDKIENLAQPHVKHKGTMIPIKYISWDNIAPAGGVNSTVLDMTKWIKMQLAHGKYKGKTYFSAEAQKEMWTPFITEKLSQTDEFLFPSKHFDLYGLGWDLFDYHGRKIVDHSGGLDGMISQVVLVPEENLGFVILTNSMNYLPYTLMYHILDVFFEKEGKDYSGIFLRIINQNELFDEQKRLQEEKDRNKSIKPSLSLDNYAGDYHSELYGDAKVSFDNNKLILQFVPAPEFISTLEHWEYNRFSVEFKEFPSLPPGKVDFIIDGDKVTEMKIDIPNPDFDFTELKFVKVK
ncbi:MAG: serine hydrolase [Bacteroidota bacterium]